MRRTLVATALLLLPVLPASAADPRVEIGRLTCEMTDRTNLIIVSDTKFSCVLVRNDGPKERLTGVADKLGVDLTVKAEERLVWIVLAPSIDAKTSGLEGTYVGGGADVAAVKGVGAKLLVGGFDQSFALQPVAVTGTDGYGVTAALERFKLTYVGPVN